MLGRDSFRSRGDLFCAWGAADGDLATTRNKAGSERRGMSQAGQPMLEHPFPMVETACTVKDVHSIDPLVEQAGGADC
jgi:hypothetical protein